MHESKTRLPLLLSVPHSGTRIAPEVADKCLLRKEEIIADSDEGAAAIYLPLQDEVRAFVTTDIARAVVDMNRAEDDRRSDGVVKTETIWKVPIYRRPLTEEEIEVLIARYHRPYHRRLSAETMSGVVLGVDCHTMAARAPPIGQDVGTERPPICLANADGTCPGCWMEELATSFEAAFELKVSVNDPFPGGYIIRSHAAELPWVMLELSRGPFMRLAEKRERVLNALQHWCMTSHAR